jgi:hypothetical protein
MEKKIFYRQKCFLSGRISLVTNDEKQAWVEAIYSNWLECFRKDMP